MSRKRLCTQLPRLRVLFEARAVSHRLMARGLEIALYHCEHEEPEHPKAAESALWLIELSTLISEAADRLEAR